MSKSFTPTDVAAHKTAASGIYIIIDSGVYDVTDFLNEHPGGSKILARMAGKDASKPFWKYHGEAVLGRYAARLKVGVVVREKAKL